VDEFMDWCEGKLWLYDQTGAGNAKTMAAVMRWCVEHRGITVFVIDNLMKCVKSDEDYDGQKWFVDEITVIARDLNVHVILIHHPRKGEDESKPPRKMDSLGAGAVINLVDNVLICYKNKPKIEARQRGEVGKHDSEPDALVIVDKQRNGEWEGQVHLWFHEAAQAYVETASKGPQDYRTPFPHLDRRMPAGSYS
jgi:twinkle protein